MTMRRRNLASMLRRLFAAALLALLPLDASFAAEGFYKGKSITFIIGSAPGGGYDTYSRLLASHLGQNLDGRPSIIPQNMPGAGSIRAANYLYNAARKDGTAIGMLDQAIYLYQILGTPDLKIDAVKFQWIGRILRNSAVLFARREAQVHRIADVFDKELIVSASGTASRLNWTVLKNALGMKFTLIQGYQGTGDSMLALERGEVDALSVEWPILRVTGQNLIREGKINLLVQTGLEKEADISQIPRMIDLARNEDERKLLELFSSPSLIGRSVVAPPGTAPERVAELRRAFMATIRDASFLADVRRTGLLISPLPGEELQAAVAKQGEFPAALIARARRAADMAGR
ncbi:MAG TPA: tripartite tricarboxylate transporter substrate-binding protein [Micropepsaceae bacterium]|nr:tripartite tricarboxylate transporter substrate-binding protein [Micropepsaceae bacterium]